MASALELFAEHGFGSTSVKAIAQRAGVSPGLIYTYFPSKDDLLRAVFERGVEEVFATLEPVRGDDPRAAIEGLVLHSFELVERDLSLWRLLYALRAQPAVVERVGIEYRTWSEAVERELEGFCRRLGLEEPEVTAKLLFALIDGANQHRAVAPDAYPSQRVARAIARLLTGGGACSAP